MAESIETLIVGGGQAGLSLSYYLRQAGREHLVLEKAAQPGEAWRNHRWDSFTLVTPNWSFRLPGAEYADDDPGGYMPRDEIVRRFERYAADFQMPVRYNTPVTAVIACDSGGYEVQTTHEAFRAHNVVVATGLFQQPKTPPFATQIPASILQLPCTAYRNPQSLPPGAVLVVGSAQSGCQIAEDLHLGGRKVYLATSGVMRAPRRYRGRDIIEWAVLAGMADRPAEKLDSPAERFDPNPQLVGKKDHPGINLHRFYRDGIVLLGHLRGYEDGRLTFAPDLKENLAKSDRGEENLIRMINEYIARAGIQAPEEQLPRLTDGYAAPEILSLDLRQAGVTTIIWATGFNFDYSLVRLPVTDSYGFPITQRGATRFPGLYFIGMPYIHQQKGGLLLGVGEDTAHLAHLITARQ